jgi:hypothetical protein
LPSVATAKAALFTKHGLGFKPKHPEPTNVVAGPFSRFERQAHAERAPRLFAQASRELPLEERALWEAAIQLDLVTFNTAEAQVTQGRTVAAWMAAQKPGAGSDRNGHPRKSFDRALLLALAMFNLLVLVALATAIVWVVGPFI